jgi:HK97 family phage major capsid protein
MASSTTTAPELTREQVQSILVQPLEAVSVFLAAGPRIFDTDGSPVRIPTLAGMDAPSWHGENEQIDEVDPDFDEITLLPSSMASIKSLTRFSNELARQSVIALDAALRDRMVRDVAAKLDHAFIAGDGTQTSTGKDTPVGLLNSTGTQELTGIGAVNLDDLHDAEGLALAANVDPARLRWFMTSRDFVNLRKLKDNDDRYQIQPDPTEAGAYRLLGHGVTVTNRIPADGGVGDNESAIVLADVSQIAVARDLSPSVKILDQTFGDYDQQAIRVVARYDAAPLNPDAVVVLRGVTG